MVDEVIEDQDITYSSDDKIRDITNALHDNKNSHVRSLLQELSPHESAELLAKIISDDRENISTILM